MLAEAVIAGKTACAAVLINPGFETGDFTGWSTFGQGWRIGIGADAYSGLYGAVNDMLSGDYSLYRGVYQNLPIVGGHIYNSWVWLRTVTMDTSESWLEIQWYDSSGTLLLQQQSAHATIDQPFTYMYITNMIAPLNAVTVSVRGIVQMHSDSGAPDFSIFDSFGFSETVVPEPSTAALLLGVCAAFCLLRRHRMLKALLDK